MSNAQILVFSSLVTTAFFWVVFLGHLSVSYKAIQAGVNGVLLLFWLIPVAFAVYCVCRMYMGRREDLMRIDLLMALVPPAGVALFILMAQIIGAWIIGK